MSGRSSILSCGALVLAAAACTARPPLAPVTASPFAAPVVAPAAADRRDPPDSPAAGSDPAAPERAQREALANAADPTDAALELAGDLAAAERPTEALAVLRRAMARSSEPALRVAAAGLLRDLGQRHLAVAELAALRAENGALAMHPGLLFELAELQWLEGSAPAAGATLAELRQAHAESRWLAEHAPAVDGLAQELATRSVPARLSVRDLLGNLRGAPSPLVRVRTLEHLLALCASQPGLEELQQRCLAIGCGDENPAVRARAIQLAAPPPGEVRADFVRTALADEAPSVRAAAAERSRELLGDAAAPLLCEHLGRETDVDVVRACHDALARGVAAPPPWPAAGVGSEAARAALQAAWRRCLQLPPDSTTSTAPSSSGS